MPLLRQKPGGPVLRVGTGKAPLRTAPTASGTTAGGTGTTGSTTETTRLALEDGALLADADGAVIVFSAV